MANTKIIDLVATTTLATTDVFPLSTAVPVTKKITVPNLAIALKSQMGFDTDDVPNFAGLLLDGDDTPGSIVLKRSADTKYKLLWWKTASTDEWVFGTRSFGTADLTLYSFAQSSEIIKALSATPQINFLEDLFEFIRQPGATLGVTKLVLKNPTEYQYGETFIDMQTTGAHMLVGVTVPDCEYPDPADGAWDGDGYLWLTDTYSLRIGVDNYEILRISKNHNVGIGLGTQDGGDGGTGTCWCMKEEPPEKLFVAGIISCGYYTDGSNYEYATLESDSGAVTLSAKTLGSGEDDINIVLAPIGLGNVKAPNLELAGYASSPPSAVAASGVVYIDTSGAKAKLMAIFPTGAAQQIAIEP
jgi:hypothetical protein